jgi:hypothetical protein
MGKMKLNNIGSSKNNSFGLKFEVKAIPITGLGGL